MPLAKAELFVTVNGVKRHLINVRENTKGDVYVTVRSGPYWGLGDSRTNVKEVRISIHPTRRSPSSTMIKFQSLLDDGTYQDSVAFTEAVKRAAGTFAPVCTTRFTRLATSYHDMLPKYAGSDHIQIDFGAFAPEMGCMSIGILVGSPSEPFPTDIGYRLRTALNQIVFFRLDTVGVPASDFAKHMFQGTRDPATLPADQQAVASEFNSGLSPDDCQWLLEYYQHKLALDNIETLIDLSASTDLDISDLRSLKVDLDSALADFINRTTGQGPS